MALRRPRPLKYLLRVFQGALIGGGAILPGISGGVLAVAFGIYQPMMALLAHPQRNLKKYWRLLLPVAIGWGLGFIVFARLIESMFEWNATFTTWLFIGLIGGTLPSLFRTAGLHGHKKQDWLSCIIAFVLFTAFMLLARTGLSASMQPTLFAFFICGVLWGLSLVVPGMTSSSLLMVLGLYLPMTKGISALDPGVIIPMLVGVAAVVLALARAINYLFETRYSLAYHIVIGLMLASTVVIVPLQYHSPTEALLSLLAAGVGFVGAWALEKFGQDEER